MPEMRADQLKENLYALLALGNEMASRILADLPPQHLRQVERAGRADWLPIEIDLDLGVAIHRAVGDEGLRRWARAALRRSMDGAILGPLLVSAVRLFGLTPAGLFKMAPQGWRAAFRGCGELVVVEAAATCAVMDLVGLPEDMQGPAFVVGIAGGLEAVLDTCRVTGEVRVEPPPPGAGARLVATWTAR